MYNVNTSLYYEWKWYISSCDVLWRDLMNQVAHQWRVVGFIVTPWIFFYHSSLCIGLLIINEEKNCLFCKMKMENRFDFVFGQKQRWDD